MNQAPILVQKFGGTSVSTAERRLQAVEHVRRARAEFEADEADDIGAGIGQVVHAVGGDGNAAGQYTDGDLAARQQ